MLYFKAPLCGGRGGADQGSRRVVYRFLATVVPLFSFCPVQNHEQRLECLARSNATLAAARSDLAAAVQRQHGSVAELEEALLLASEELRRPRTPVSLQDVMQLSQRLGYVTSAPLGWMVCVRARVCYFHALPLAPTCRCTIHFLPVVLTRAVP